MSDLANQDPFWLNVTNIGLGIFCLLCLLLVLAAVACDLIARRKRLARGPSRWVVLRNKAPERESPRPSAAG